MGKLFRSWFKKKRKHESTLPSTDKNQHIENERQLIGARIHSDDEALTFTHGSLLDDVLSGLKDHHDDEKSKKDAPDSPLSSSIRAPLPDHRSQQKQINNRLSENNGSSIYQQSVVTQTPPCRQTPDSPSISPSPPSQMVAPPGSAATPSTTATTKLTPSPLPFNSSSSSALPAQSILQPNNVIDQLNGATTVVMTSTPLESGISDGPNGHGTIIKNNQQQQKAGSMILQDQSQLDEHQDQHEQLSSQQHPVVKAPSIISSKVSHDSNQDKRNRYLQATGVSMSRMKERHRQECRRSMQPNSNQLNVSTQQQPDQLQPTQTPISSAPHSPFQSNQFGQHPQQAQQKKLNQMAQRHYLTSPSMPALHTLESMSAYSPHSQSQQQLGSTIPATTTAGASFPLLPPAGTVPPNSIVRSSSLMTDIYQSTSSIPDSGITTSSPLPNDFTHQQQQHQWRQQPLFPYQSDIVLPPYNPSQLNTIPTQQHMMMPSPSSYRFNATSANHKQMFPRSASVYGGINQYHQQKQHDIMDRISHGGGFLLRTSMVDSTLQPNISAQSNRKSMPSTPRLYKPQLSLANLPPSDQHQQQNVKKSKRHSVASVVEDAPSDDTSPVVDLPASFLPSTHSPCDAPKNDIETLATAVTSSSSSTSSSTQHEPSPNDTNINQERMDDANSSSNKDDNDEENVARSNSSCTINPSSTSTSSPPASIKNEDSNGGLDEKLEIPSLVEHLPTKLQQQAELRIMKKHRQPHRRRRRFSLPTMPTAPSASSSTSSLSSTSTSKVEKDASGVEKTKKSLTQLSGNNKTTENASQKMEAPTLSNDCTHQQPNTDHSTHGGPYQQQQQQQPHHHPGLPVPVCSISGSHGSSPSHRGSWSANSYHSCVAPLAVNTAPLCCPPTQQHNCQQHSHHHYHQPQHFHHSCGHPSSIPLATTSLCCSTPPYIAPPVVQPALPAAPPPPCCSQSYHYRHHHHHHSHHQRCQHRHSHHHAKQQPPPPLLHQMKKSSSVMTKVDQDDTATIRSSATKSVLGQKGRQQQQKKMTPPSPPTAEDDDDDDDDNTISGVASASPEKKKPMTSQSVQRPLFRSFLPRPPRFSTSIPRPPQQPQQQQPQSKKQQQSKVKVSASKSSYSWIPSRA